MKNKHCLALLALLLLMTASNASITAASCLDDVSYYLLKHGSQLAVMVFYDTEPNQFLYDGFYSLFQSSVTDTQFGKDLYLKLQLLKVDVSKIDVSDLFDTLPLVTVLDNGNKVLEEKLALDTRDHILEYLNRYQPEMIKKANGEEVLPSLKTLGKA